MHLASKLLSQAAHGQPTLPREVDGISSNLRAILDFLYVRNKCYSNAVSLVTLLTCVGWTRAVAGVECSVYEPIQLTNCKVMADCQGRCHQFNREILPIRCTTTTTHRPVCIMYLLLSGSGSKLLGSQTHDFSPCGRPHLPSPACGFG